MFGWMDRWDGMEGRNGHPLSQIHYTRYQANILSIELSWLGSIICSRLNYYFFILYQKQDNADKRFDSNPLVGLTTQTQADKDELELPILNRVKKVTDSRKKRSHPYKLRTGRQSEYNPRFGYSPPGNSNQQQVEFYKYYNNETLCRVNKSIYF